MKQKTHPIPALLAITLLAMACLDKLECLAQPVFLSIQQSNGQAVVSWPQDLGDVQPQRSTNSVEWEDFGPQVTDSNVTDSLAGSAALYRLMFVPPGIVGEPIDQSAPTGGDAEFSVSATGTTPFNYRWRKDGTNLGDQTGVSLVLTNLSPENAGNFDVVVANRAGSITSLVATLTVTNPVPTIRGIYTADFAGSHTNQGLIMMVQSNLTAMALGFRGADTNGVLLQSFTVGSDGGFSAFTPQNIRISGSVSNGAISGTYLKFPTTDTFSGARKPDAGIHTTDTGYYTGTASGPISISVFGILAADGTMFFYIVNQPNSSNPNIDLGGFGFVDASNQLQVGLGSKATVNGSLSASDQSRTISGSYSYPPYSGTFMLNRMAVP